MKKDFIGRLQSVESLPTDYSYLEEFDSKVI